jgi:hypothetical protein
MSREKILAKAVLQFMRATYIPTAADAEMGKELENMALEILKDEKTQDASGQAFYQTPINPVVLRAMGYRELDNGFKIEGRRCFVKANYLHVVEHTNDKGEKMYTIGQTMREIKTVKDLGYA